MLRLARQPGPRAPRDGRLRLSLDAKAESVCLHFGHLMPYFEVFATHKILCSFSLRQFVYCVICACERAPCTRWPL